MIELWIIIILMIIGILIKLWQLSSDKIAEEIRRSHTELIEKFK